MVKASKNYSLIIRNFTFGVEDSLVSTVGLLAGIAVAGMSSKHIILTGVVLIFVEAISMAVGSLLSEHSVEEYESKKETNMKQPIIAAAVMFISYIVAGLIPLTPYLIKSGNMAVLWSIGLTLVSLFMLGIFNGRMFKAHALKDGLLTLFMGGLAIAVGIAVGQIADKL